MPTLRLGVQSQMYPVMEGWAGSWEGGGGKGKVSVLCSTFPNPSLQLEALNQSINIEQSQSDRSKRPFNPVT